MHSRNRFYLKDRTKRWLVLALAAAAALCYAAAYWVPMWGFYLFAPQYPQGLTLEIFVNRVAGDTSEINILNHYIGMAKLEEAAKLERALSVYLLAGLGLISMLLVFFPGRRYARYFAAPAMAFPLVFTAFMYLWMYKFGHELSPNAPVHIASFTPTMLGTGRIGNFHTYGLPGPGFYLILASAISVAASFLLRRNVCSGCPHASTCRMVCPTLFFGKPHPMPGDAPDSHQHRSQ